MTTGPAPQMTACEACHRRGVIAAREAARLTARWSVRAMFNHRVHATKVAVDCARCHTNMSAPTTMLIAAPPKAACAAAGCHDGGGAFKVTGTSCTRCHPGAPK
jgi:c(7)-type cytochrome triheme protein